MSCLSFEEFKGLIKTNKTFKKEICESKNDIIDFDNGSMLIHRANLNKYLEKYMCKDESDLEDTLWYNYGTVVKIIE